MEISIDTASETASVALSNKGLTVAEYAWNCHRRHSVELLPTIEQLLKRVDSSVEDISAVFVCTGPGLYTGLRVGISTAQGLSYSLGVPLLGVGRLELDSFPYLSYEGNIVPIHDAGRGEVAWAIYKRGLDGDMEEIKPPALNEPESLPDKLLKDSLICGDVSGDVGAMVKDLCNDIKIAVPIFSVRHASYLALLGYKRLVDGAKADPAYLKPIYLRQAVVQSKNH